MVLATARLLGVPLRASDAAPDDDPAAPRFGESLFRNDRPPPGRISAFVRPPQPADGRTIEDILRQA